MSAIGIRLLLASLAVAWFATAAIRPLGKPDEGRYAEIAREMAASGDWVTPRLNGFKYFEKPPLQYWITAAAFRVFGFEDWVARLWSALAGFLGVACTWFAADRLFGRPTGLLAATVLAGTLLYVLVGQLNTLDAGMTLFLSCALFSFALAQRDEASASERARWMLGFWSACAFAVLSKGLAGIVLPLASVGLYVAVRRDWRLLGRIAPLRGPALFLLIVAPWFAAVISANDEFARLFFVQEHWQRFLTRIHGRYQPWWYFVPILVLGAISWVCFILPAILRGLRGGGERFRPALFLSLAAILQFVFFSASSSKLPSYIVPALPPLAVLIGCYLWVHWSRGLFVAQAAAAAAAGAVVAAISSAAPDAFNLPAGFAPWLTASALLFAGGAALASALAWRDARIAAVVTLSAGGIAGVLTGLLGHGAVSHFYSAKSLLAQAEPRLDAGVPFYAVDAYDHTIPWYLKRTVTMVAYRDELAKAIEREPQKFVPDLAAFAEAWAKEGRAYAIFAVRDFDGLRARFALPVEIVARDPRYVLVRKP